MTTESLKFDRKLMSGTSVVENVSGGTLVLKSAGRLSVVLITTLSNFCVVP